MAQIFLGYNILGQANSASSTITTELYFMWCMLKKIRVHLGYWLAYGCHNIAKHGVRHLRTCHIPGAYLKNNVYIEYVKGTTKPKMCPKPTPADKAFYIRTKVIKMRNGIPHFYEIVDLTSHMLDLQASTLSPEEYRKVIGKDHLGAPTKESAISPDITGPSSKKANSKKSQKKP